MTVSFSLSAQNSPQTENQKFKTADASFSSYFGVSLDHQQDTLVVGAMYHTHNGIFDAGAAYVFSQDENGLWHEADLLTASDALNGDVFGRSVAMHGDTILVGSPYAYHSTASYSGRGYVFENNNGSWVETQSIEFPETRSNSRFGNEVAMNEGFLFIAAPNALNDVGRNNGAVFVYHQVNGVWTFLQKLTNTINSSSGKFGDYLIATDDLFVVTSFLEETDDGIQRGASYVYEYDPINGWQLDQHLSPESNSNIYGFGAIAANEDTLLVRSQTGNIPANENRQLEIYQKINDSWQVTGEVLAPENGMDEYFAVKAEIHEDKLLVSSIINPANAPDYYVVYFYIRQGGHWQYKSTLIPSDPTEDSGFGIAFTVGETDVLVGSYLEDTINIDSGAVYGYDIDTLFIDGFD